MEVIKSFESKNLKEYLEKGGLKGYENVNDLSVNEIENSGLLGRSGSYFPTGKKMKFVLSSGKERYMICNADEGEPGTFKDRYILERNIYLFVEGLAIAQRIIKPKKTFIYLRYAYRYLEDRITKAIRDVEKHLGINMDVKIVTGFGGYIIGEETTLMNSIEGLRPEPRHKPPYPPEIGLGRKPTLIDNVETFANLPIILSKGSEWYKKNADTKLFCISGDADPCIVEIKFGEKFSKVLRKAKVNTKNIKGVLLGPSAGFLPKKFFNLTVHPKTFMENGFYLGTGAVIVIGKNRNIPKLCKIISDFFVDESCGKCTPCREGGKRLNELLKRYLEGKGDIGLIKELADFVSTSFCPLGQSSGIHIKTAMKYFGDEWV